MSFNPSGPTTKRHREGTHRCLEISETLNHIRPRLTQLGITRLADVTGLDILGIPVFAAHRPNSRSLSVAFGKGASADAARVSALMEALESHHAEHIQKPLLRMSHSELRRTYPVVDVHALPRLSVSSFQDELPLLWVEGKDMANDCSKWIPYELVHTDFRVPFPCGTGAFAMSSNGLASGNHILEATLHGLCEVVERDATTLWHALDPKAREETRLDLSSTTNETCAALFERVERAGLAIGVWETTSDVGIPCFLAILTEQQPDPLGGTLPHSGMGCHPSREVALLRAVTEAAQGRLTVISGARDDLTNDEYRRGRVAEREKEIVRRVVGGVGRRRLADVPNFDGETIELDLGWAMSRLGAVGLDEVVVVDLSLPSFGIPVVRVVVPGLEFMHDAPAYIPGKRAQKRLRERQT